MMPFEVEILVPVLPEEDKLLPLLETLSRWQDRAIIAIGVVSSNHEDLGPEDSKKISLEEAKKYLINTQFSPDLNYENIKWILAPKGRGLQLNAAAQYSEGNYLWFLHGDSRLEDQAWEKVTNFTSKHSDQLGYGFLSFDQDGPILCRLNALGANFRSQFFDMPFEDQGLVISKENFRMLGGFSTIVPYGEGHDLVWRAKEIGLKVRPIGYKITTSARRYSKEGWLKTTSLFFYLTWKQALPYLYHRVSFKKHYPTAIVVFVKTPGLSHLKTRLSRTIGIKEAENFQKIAILQISATLKELKNVSFYWAVSESDGLHGELWKQNSRIWQSDGDLGDKLHYVYSSLLRRHTRVLIIGSDAPQISRDHLKQAEAVLERRNFVMGPAQDGGFWLFGGRVQVSRNIWKATPWSAPNTYQVLSDALPNPPGRLEVLTDVDTLEDLSQMLKECQSLHDGGSIQREFLDTCQRIVRFNAAPFITKQQT
jgi:rSAM/selenodomain-associated transferase 1